MPNGQYEYEPVKLDECVKAERELEQSLSDYKKLEKVNEFLGQIYKDLSRSNTELEQENIDLKWIIDKILSDISLFVSKEIRLRLNFKKDMELAIEYLTKDISYHRKTPSWRITKDQTSTSKNDPSKSSVTEHPKEQT